jgi:hypothetical protein
MSEDLIKVSPHPRTLNFTLRFVALVQFILGLGFLVAPTTIASLLGLAAAPGWANWMFGMMAARFLGFGYGMLVAARQPATNLAWLRAMIAIQLIDWAVTVKYLAIGAVSLAQVSTASFLPLVFVALMWWAWPRTRQMARI